MKQDKFLTGIIIGIIVIVVIAMVVFFTRQSNTQEYQADDQPTGVVFNYLLALQKGDYEKAYGYLSDMEGKPDLSKFRQDIRMNQPQMDVTAVDVTSELIIDGDTATVLVGTTYSGNGLFNGDSRNTENARLEKVAGKWKLISVPYPYWSYDWYQPVLKP
ncbi:MAG: DUF4878 domain-containing protein [Anaerolineaceae bacterium]|nr:DUF4878 domain-containing protein [Anaerolineaceae bacterium]NTV36962.1 DUF4878 domain-containing protein [Anaerolineaceae bacterium]